MNETFGEIKQQHDHEIAKKKRLWRNLFLLNLCVSLFLVGIFWLPSKLEQVADFLNSPSVNIPEEGKMAKKPVVVEEPEEPQEQEKFVARAPAFSPPPSKPDQPEMDKRNEAVQAYLDFFESALVKIGELIKTGLTKGKDFLIQSFG